MSLAITPRAALIDMDGVLVRGGRAIPGAATFINRLRAAATPFVLLTNNAGNTPEGHAAKLNALGINVPTEAIFTSANAMASYLSQQRPNGSAFVLGGIGLVAALTGIGYTLTDANTIPDYLVLGEGATFDQAAMEIAVRLIRGGARFAVTSPDKFIPTPHGPEAAPGTWAAQIAAATGITPIFVGKPTPTMFATALSRLGVKAHETVMIGDTLDTDIQGGLAAGCQTILVLSGNTAREDIPQQPWRPTYVRGSVAEINPLDLSRPIAPETARPLPAQRPAPVILPAAR